MLNAILSHWVMYLFVPYVLILSVLILVYREQPLRIYRKVRWIPAHVGRAAMRWHPRLRQVR